MPVVVDIGYGRIKLYVYADEDHPIPHAHARAPGAEASFEIATGDVLASKGFNERTLKRIQREVVKHSDVLMAKWEELNDEDADEE